MPWIRLTDWMGQPVLLNLDTGLAIQELNDRANCHVVRVGSPGTERFKIRETIDQIEYLLIDAGMAPMIVDTQEEPAPAPTEPAGEPEPPKTPDITRDQAIAPVGVTGCPGNPPGGKHRWRRWSNSEVICAWCNTVLPKREA